MQHDLGVISALEEQAAEIRAPRSFRTWALISVVSALVSRRVWTEIIAGRPLFGNIFAMLVAEPAIGKSNSADLARELLVAYPQVSLSPDKVTQEELLRRLGKTFTGLEEPGCRSYLGLLSEFGTFMPKADVSYMQGLARLWDCPKIFEYATKNQGTDRVDHPFLSLLMGVQPAWFAHGFPADALDMGFPARIILVYESEAPARVYTASPPDSDAKEPVNFTPAPKSAARLNGLAQAAGYICMKPEALKHLQDWANEGFAPAPIDPLLKNYAARRDVHVAKLALLVALARNPQARWIELDDLKTAQALLIDTEHLMSNAVEGAGGNSLRMKERSIIAFVRAREPSFGGKVPEHLIRKYLGRMVDINTSGRLIDELLARRELTLAFSDPNDPHGMKQRPHRLLRTPKETNNAG